CINARVGGPALQTSNQSGMNLYIGNVLSRDGTYQPLSPGSQHPEAMREDTRRLAAGLLAARSGRPVDAARLGDGAASGILWRETLRHVAASPGRWVRLLLRKTRLFWSDYEIPDAEGFVVFRQLSALLGLAAVSLGLLAPLATVGLLPAWRRDRRVTAALVLLTAATFASVVTFFVLGRYRLPVVLFLLPLAGCGTSWLVELARGRRWRALHLALLVVLVLMVGSRAPAFPAATRDQHEAALWFNLGQAGNRWAGDLLEGAATAITPAQRHQRAVEGAARAEAATGFLTQALRRDHNFFTARIERAVAMHRWGSCLLLAGDPRLAAQRYAVALAELDAALRAVPSWAGPDLWAQMLALQRAAQRNLAAARRASPPSPP
ncbi:MAG TPA: hypothetical protein VGV61_06705, partial [Thermoanaerobaculia bacterium]|nr:hypothetical protein [Thermoanaerobaculia bacterium]